MLTFPQIPTNEQSPLILNHCTYKQSTTYVIKNPGPGLVHAQNSGIPLLISGSPTAIQM